jgi:hypothetical protein
VTNQGSALRDFLRGGIDRLWDRGWPVLQTAVAVGLAWYQASVIFGHEQPVFASIAALISLGVSVGRQWKRAMQVILGVGSGIVLARFLVLVVGAGPLQMVLVVGLALVAAVFLGAEPLLAGVRRRYLSRLSKTQTQQLMNIWDQLLSREPESDSLQMTDAPKYRS